MGARRSSGGIVVSGGILTTEVRRRKRGLLHWVRLVLLILGNEPVSHADGPFDIVVWNSDRSRVLYREGPIFSSVIEYSLRQFQDDIDRYGIEMFVARRKSGRDDGKWM
jgi:hypothetical protein